MTPLRAAALACLLAVAAPGAPAEEEHVPAPYEPEEFPSWVHELRRAEIVFFGSLPFTLFFTFEAYDLGRYLASGFDADGFDALLAPWPFRSAAEIGAGYTPAEKGWLIASALAASLGVAAADWLIVHWPEWRENR